MSHFLALLLFSSCIKSADPCAATGGGTTNACTTCVELPSVDNGIGTPGVFTQTLGENASGCVTNVALCTGQPGVQTIIFWYDADGNDAGVTMGTGTATETLTCNADGEWVIDGFIAPVTSYECVFAG